MSIIVIYTILMLMLAITFAFGFAIAFLMQKTTNMLYYFSSHTLGCCPKYVWSSKKEADYAAISEK